MRSPTARRWRSPGPRSATRRRGSNPQARTASTAAGRRVAFAEAVRAEVEARKRRLGILSYDDLLSQLADALEADDSPARVRMRERWQIVLVDEFQDTDPVQWQVLDRAFTGFATMVLIGDPKQAIYAFRGGDVTTYLAAADTATTQQTLSVNWRSDAGLLDAVQRLLDGAELGDDRIVVRPVTAHHGSSRLDGAPVAAAAPAPRRAPRHLRQGAAGLVARGRRPAARRARPRPRRPQAAQRRAHLRGAPARAARRRRHLLPPRRPRRVAARPARRRCAGRDRGWRAACSPPRPRSSG